MLVSRHFVQLGEFEVSEEGGIRVGEISRTASGSTPTTSATTPLNPTLHRAIPPLPIPSASLITPTTSATTPLNATLHRAIPPLPILSASLNTPPPLFPPAPTPTHSSPSLSLPPPSIPASSNSLNHPSIETSAYKLRYFSAPYFGQIHPLRHSSCTFSLSALRASRKKETTVIPNDYIAATFHSIPKKETARLDLHSLTSIISSYVTTSAEAASIIEIDDESEDDFGRLDAEQKARNDEYEDRNRMEPAERRVTRLQSRRAETHKLAILRRRRATLAEKVQQPQQPMESNIKSNLLLPPIPKKSTTLYGIDISQNTATNPPQNQSLNRPRPQLKIPGKQAVQSHIPILSLTRQKHLHQKSRPQQDISDVSSVSITEDEDRSSLLESRGLYTHSPYTNDETEFNLINQIVRGIIDAWEEKLESTFQEFVSDILPLALKQSVDGLTQQFRRNLYSPGIEKILLSITADLEASTHTGTDGKQFAAAARILMFVPCSEASCERLFSLTKFISGKRRYNLKLPSLNGCIMLAQEREIENLYSLTFSEKK